MDALERFNPDYVIFNSGSAARNLRELLGPERVSTLAKRTTFAAIGPIAAKSAEEAGMNVSIVPDRHRVPDLVDALVAFDAGR